MLILYTWTMHSEIVCMHVMAKNPCAPFPVKLCWQIVCLSIPSHLWKKEVEAVQLVAMVFVCWVLNLLQLSWMFFGEGSRHFRPKSCVEMFMYWYLAQFSCILQGTVAVNWFSWIRYNEETFCMWTMWTGIEAQLLEAVTNPRWVW